MCRPLIFACRRVSDQHKITYEHALHLYNVSYIKMFMIAELKMAVKLKLTYFGISQIGINKHYNV